MMMCTFRLDEALVERLDAYASRMSEKQPGMTFTRADVVRILLAKSLGKTEALDAALPVCRKEPAVKSRRTAG
jgi:hypothetical protein